MKTSNFLNTQLILNWITRVLFFTSMSALLPTLPNYISDIGGNKSQVGMVMSSFALGVFIFRPLIGKSVDSVGRKIVLIFGIIIFVISPVLYHFIHTIGVLIPVRIFHGLGLAAFGTASITLITDSAPMKQRGKVISYTGMVNTIAFALGPIAGSFIGDKWGYDILFFIVAALSFGCLLFSLFLKETKEHDVTQKNVGYLKAVMQRPILISFLIILLIAMTHGAVIIYMPIFIKENFNINVGIFFFIFGVSTLVIRIWIGRVSDKWGRGPLIVFALLFMTMGVLLLRQSNNFSILALAAIVYGFGFGAQQPMLTALVADNTKDETRGKIFSFYYGGFDLGISITGILLGAVAEFYGIRNMFLICSLLTLAALIVFIGFFEQGVAQSLRCAFSLQKSGENCYICDQYQEVAPEQAEEFFKSK